MKGWWPIAWFVPRSPGKATPSAGYPAKIEDRSWIFGAPNKYEKKLCSSCGPKGQKHKLIGPVQLRRPQGCDRGKLGFCLGQTLIFPVPLALVLFLFRDMLALAWGSGGLALV